ncbi:hypothetical protein GCM10009851_37090 [Herbiconiux moechotypicola]|uniref:Cell wall-binding repeat-containing protein n=2 Tax=Herbiconiux moechotypicola TaxID=637393 RepID=A0ABN3E4E6_9MICO
MTIGVPTSTDIYDTDGGSFTPSISAGTLPTGLALVNPAPLAAQVVGTPTTLGSFVYSIKLTDNLGRYAEKTCMTDVLPVGSTVSRLGGLDRYHESVLIGDQVTKGADAPLVYVASGEKYADALSAASVAAQRGAPLLLTTTDRVPEVVTQAIVAYKARQIVVVGGESSISMTGMALLSVGTSATVTRIGGVDRYDTSRKLISDTTFGAKPSTELFVASGTKFPDALSASPAAATIPAPVLLVNGAEPTLTAAEHSLVTGRGVKKVTVFGGEDTLSRGLNDSLAAAAGASSRIDGADRYAVAARSVAKHFPSTIPSDTVYLATGTDFPDALAGGALAGANHAPILLVSKSCMTRETAAEITRLKPQHLVLLGGPNTLDAALGRLPICN